MSITTRINGSSEVNFMVEIVSISTDEVLATVSIEQGQKADLQINANGCYLRKVSGWESSHRKQ